MVAKFQEQEENFKAKYREQEEVFKAKYQEQEDNFKAKCQAQEEKVKAKCEEQIERFSVALLQMEQLLKQGEEARAGKGWMSSCLEVRTLSSHYYD